MDDGPYMIIDVSPPHFLRARGIFFNDIASSQKKTSASLRSITCWSFSPKGGCKIQDRALAEEYFEKARMTYNGFPLSDSMKLIRAEDIYAASMVAESMGQAWYLRRLLEVMPCVIHGKVQEDKETPG